MGKYAVFILGSYGATAVVFAFLVVSSLLHARRWRKKAEERASK